MLTSPAGATPDLAVSTEPSLESVRPSSLPGQTPPAHPNPSTRLVSLDAYRGAIMLLMASSGLGVATVAREFPQNPFWTTLARHVEHAEWVGCTLWDLIQPAFMFMVGVAVPWSIANRQARGQSRRGMILHALWRSLVLVLLAVFLTSAWSPRTNWVFTNVLAQIGLGYPFLFLLAFTRPRTQWIAAFSILFLYWLAFVLHPLPSPDFDWAAAGIPGDWTHLQGFEAHWEKNANVAAAFDRWFLNLFPAAEPFRFSTGGYQTLNFVPSLVTMTFGLLAGQLLRGNRSLRAKLLWLLAAGSAGILLGWAIAWCGWCPIIKRIWTPAWTLYSAGWVTLILLAFVAVIEGMGWRRWAFPLVVVGLNPITLYCMWQLMGGFIRDNLRRHLGTEAFGQFGTAYAPMLERAAVLLVFWLILFWMYRRRIFIRI